MYSSAGAMSHALEELVGHVDWLQRSLILSNFGLDQWPISTIYRRCASHPSRDKTDVFVLKDAILQDCPAPKQWFGIGRRNGVVSDHRTATHTDYGAAIPRNASIEYFPAPVMYNNKKPPIMLTFL
jgi:hypothetical protein